MTFSDIAFISQSFKVVPCLGCIFMPQLPLNVNTEKGVAEITLTEASLEKAIADAGLSKDTVTVVFFCQGPQCHMSYNATQAAINDWGYSPEKIIWFRAGYPGLFQMVKDSPKLKRKAKKYLSQEGINRL